MSVLGGEIGVNLFSDTYYFTLGRDGLRLLCVAVTMRCMRRRLRLSRRSRWWITGGCCLCLSVAAARPSEEPRPSPPRAARANLPRQDDSLMLQAPKDLALRPDGEHKARAMVDYIRALDLQDEGETQKALEAFERVLNVDPGEIYLATRVAFLLTQQGDYPRAIDILKDAVKVQPKEAGPYLQLAYIYAKYLKKMAPAIRYAEEAVKLAPDEIEGYQRLAEVQLAARDRKAALHTLDRAAVVETNVPAFWTQLGKLYLALLNQLEKNSKPADLQKVNAVFLKALALAPSDASVLSDAADYFAASQQVQEAIPLYLRVLELQPNDSNAREKLATGFMLTNQRGKAIAMLQEIIQQHPEKYQPYELLGRVLEEDAKALAKAKKMAEAKAEYAKAAANFEQSLLINSAQPDNYVHLAELLLTRLRDNERAVRVLREARRHFPNAPQITYLLAIALREAGEAQRAVATFEEALHESETNGQEIVNARFFFEYGAAAERAGLYDKAAELFKRAIEVDPAEAAQAYNYLGFMWADQNMHLDEAEDYIQRALAADPENGAYLDSLGWLHYRQGSYEQALAELLKAVAALKEEDSTVFDHIGDTYSKLNQTDKALEYWQKALALDQGNKKLAAKVTDAKTRLSKGEPAGATPIK
ncbi:MAG: tetratricopeptide repeat protein [Solirubrobacterales bacterium]|nr:tetratricopeptide repeat protein [Solirubrobacterales bacterium]